MDGQITILWDGRDEPKNIMAAGIYYYSLQALPVSNEQPIKISGKVVLLK